MATGNPAPGSQGTVKTTPKPAAKVAPKSRQEEMEELRAMLAASTSRLAELDRIEQSEQRAAAMASVKEALTESMATIDGDFDDANAHFQAVLAGINTAREKLIEAGPAFGATVRVPRAGTRTGGSSTPRGPRTGGHRETVLAWFRQHADAENVTPGYLTKELGLPSSGHVRNILVGASYAEGELGGLAREGYVQVSSTDGPLSVDAVTGKLVPDVLKGVTTSNE